MTPSLIKHFASAAFFAFALLANPAFAEDSANEEYRSDFSDFQPAIRFGICHNSFMAEAASLRQLMVVGELFTTEGQTRLKTKTATALYKAGLTGTRSWHLSARAAKFAKSYAELQAEPVNQFCHLWFEEQEKLIDASEVDEARKIADNWVQELFKKAADAAAERDKDSS